MEASASADHDGQRRRKQDDEEEEDDSSGKSSSSSSSSGSSTREALYGALVRAFVVLFARPVRLFRPVKVTSLQLLESLAKREGRTLSLRYLWRVLRREKWSFLPHLLGPPLLYQTLVGFSLFSVYTVTEATLVRKREQQQQQLGSAGTEHKEEKPSHATFTPLSIVVASGAAAGVAQCILSAPLDNVRFILESGIAGQTSGPAATSTQSTPTQAERPRHRDLSRRSGFGAGRKLRPTSSSAAAVQVSWRAVAKAALLPFLPAHTHSRVKDQVIQQGKQIAETALQAAAATGQSGPEAAKKRAELWQTTLKAWRGGLHGSGLIMSLCRDSVGFSAFFIVFELSRRCAYHSSMAVDRFEAWINTTIPLLRFSSPSPTPQPGSDLVHAQPVPRSHRNEDNSFHIESAQQQYRSNARDPDSIQPDISYNATRTLSGRVIAALVLVVGGAIGATLYELVGRPFELMRLVIFTGTRRWEGEVQRWRSSQEQSSKGARQTTDRGRAFLLSGRSARGKAASASTRTVRAASPDRLAHGRSSIRGARLRALEHAVAIRSPSFLSSAHHQQHHRAARSLGVGLFLTLRSENTMGGSTSRVSLSLLNARRRPAHPLALMPEKRSQARERDARMRQSWERARERGEMTGLTYRIATGARARGAGGSSADTHPQSARVRKEEEEPPRPSALALLTAHAKHTDPAFLREALQHYPRPLALLALLGKAYFVGPFVANAGKGDTYLGALKADELKARERRAARAAASAAAAGRKRSNLDFRSNHDGSGGSVGARNGAASSERSRAPASSTSTTLESYYRLRDRGTHAWDGAMRWGSVAWESRWGWALRRMATPYGLGFLAFAWYGGDLNR
ncbi:hypothetical protein V8E36_004056 [Tilletia maclaganii]